MGGASNDGGSVMSWIEEKGNKLMKMEKKNKGRWRDEREERTVRGRGRVEEGRSLPSVEIVGGGLGSGKDLRGGGWGRAQERDKHSNYWEHNFLVL